MRDFRRTRNFGLTLILGLFLFGAAAGGANAEIVSNASCCSFGPNPFTQAAGEVNTYTNPVGSEEGSFHNVVATDPGPDGNPLFESDVESAGGSSPVKGTQYLTPGSYNFYCTIHGTGMSGQLVVDGGTPVARPSVKLTVPSQKLKQVGNSGKLKVSLKGLTDSSGVSIVAKAGSTKLGSASGSSVTSGATKTIVIKLTSAGKKAVKKAVKKKKKVSVSVKATVPYGKSVSASRKLQ